MYLSLRDSIRAINLTCMLVKNKWIKQNGGHFDRNGKKEVFKFALYMINEAIYNFHKDFNTVCR